MSTGEVAINYLNSTNYMFLGGLIMAIAVEHSGLHNRVALRIIMRVSHESKDFIQYVRDRKGEKSNFKKKLDF